MIPLFFLIGFYIVTVVHSLNSLLKYSFLSMFIGLTSLFDIIHFINCLFLFLLTYKNRLSRYQIDYPYILKEMGKLTKTFLKLLPQSLYQSKSPEEESIETNKPTASAFLWSLEHRCMRDEPSPHSLNSD